MGNPPQLNKYRGALKLLKEMRELPDGNEYDNWVFYLDSDIVITNHNQSLEQVLQPLLQGDEIIDLVLSRDSVAMFPINTGVFFLRDAPWSVDLITYFLENHLKIRDSTCPVGRISLSISPSRSLILGASERTN